tara:strand:- start:121 stop:378 length:258 start_codon:yes stop_codon:yes gene_type:complete
MVCKYCGDTVDKIINYCGTGICMDCYTRMKRWGKYNPKEDLSDKERQERLIWMHRETFLDEEDFQKALTTSIDVAVKDSEPLEWM